MSTAGMPPLPKIPRIRKSRAGGPPNPRSQRKKEVRHRKKRDHLPEAISIKMAMDLLDVSENTIRRWIHNRYIKAYRVGPLLIRIPRSEIARMRSVRLAYTNYGDKVDYPQV